MLLYLHQQEWLASCNLRGETTEAGAGFGTRAITRAPFIYHPPSYVCHRHRLPSPARCQIFPTLAPSAVRSAGQCCHQLPPAGAVIRPSRHRHPSPVTRPPPATAPAICEIFPAVPSSRPADPLHLKFRVKWPIDQVNNVYRIMCYYQTLGVPVRVRLVTGKDHT